MPWSGAALVLHWTMVTAKLSVLAEGIRGLLKRCVYPFEDSVVDMTPMSIRAPISTQATTQYHPEELFQKNLNITAMPRGRRSRRSTDDDYSYAPSRAASPSYRPSSYSYSADPYPYTSTSYSRTADPYPSHSTSYTTYEYIPVSPPPRSRTPARDTTTYDTTYPSSSSYRPRRRSPSPYRPSPSPYHRPSTPPRTTYIYPPRPRSPPPRPYSPITTARTRPFTPPPRAPSRHRRDRSRHRHRSPSRSRVHRFTDTVASALDSVPREDVRELGTAFGGFVADQLGWGGVDGRTTDQREGRDRWRGGEGFWGYSTMG
jgi:hypothetical protein